MMRNIDDYAVLKILTAWMRGSSARSRHRSTNHCFVIESDVARVVAGWSERIDPNGEIVTRLAARATHGHTIKIKRTYRTSKGT
jgi:hypothetical protein